MRGVYEIRNTTTGESYIGSSEDIEKRWQVHRQELAGNRHDNDLLYESWRQYGQSAFEFRVIYEAHQGEDIRDIELWHIERYGPAFNIQSTPKQSARAKARLNRETKDSGQLPQANTISSSLDRFITTAETVLTPLASGNCPVCTAELRVAVGLSPRWGVRIFVNMEHQYDGYLTAMLVPTTDVVGALGCRVHCSDCKTLVDVQPVPCLVMDATGAHLYVSEDV